MKNPSYQPARLDLGDATLLIADQGDLTFTGMDWPTERTIWTDGSTQDAYIPDGAHVLPAHAALPILKSTERWACPPASKFEEVKLLLAQTTGIWQIEDPDWSRIYHLAMLHLGGPQPANTPHLETRIEWWQENAGSNLGYTRKRGWYFGTLPGRDGNGWSNWHYNRLLWMTVALCYASQEEREAAWPFYIQQAAAYTCFGRAWSGPNEGQSRDEKGQVYVGDSGRWPYEKDWVSNLVGPWMLTGQELFKEALDKASTFYANLPLTAWQGAWGSRIPARIIENMLQLHMVGYVELLPSLSSWLTHVGTYLDRANWIWPNLGNRGDAPETPFMQSELSAVILRVWEQIPSLRDVGVTRAEIVKVMQRVMDTSPSGGSDLVNGFACLKYRYHTPTNTGPMFARFASNTAFALPALRLLQNELPAQYVNCREFVQRYAGSSMSDVAAGTPYDINQIGYRFPREGSAWPKTVLTWVEAVR